MEHLREEYCERMRKRELLRWKGKEGVLSISERDERMNGLRQQFTNCMIEVDEFRGPN